MIKLYAYLPLWKCQLNKLCSVAFLSFPQGILNYVNLQIYIHVQNGLKSGTQSQLT